MLSSLTRLLTAPLYLASSMLLTIIACILMRSKRPVKTITIKSADNVPVSADVYMPHPRVAPFIILCHRADWSRGEYLEIAAWLNALGFNCMAIDQRSGGEVNGIKNETAAAARKQGKALDYPNAMTDIQAALDFSAKKFAKGKIILWGSSYSASLALIIAALDGAAMNALVCFSPGEYFEEFSLGRDYVISHARQVSVPVFIAAPVSEKTEAEQLSAAIPAEDKRLIIPEYGGFHGSEALWTSNEGYEFYRHELERFLEQFL